MREVALKLDSYSSMSEKEIQKKTIYLPTFCWLIEHDILSFAMY